MATEIKDTYSVEEWLESFTGYFGEYGFVFEGHTLNESKEARESILQQESVRNGTENRINEMLAAKNEYGEGTFGKPHYWSPSAVQDRVADTYVEKPFDK